MQYHDDDDVFNHPKKSQLKKLYVCVSDLFSLLLNVKNYVISDGEHMWIHTSLY